MAAPTRRPFIDSLLLIAHLIAVLEICLSVSILYRLCGRVRHWLHYYRLLLSDTDCINTAYCLVALTILVPPFA
jgi:hypothetical protein